MGRGSVDWLAWSGASAAGGWSPTYPYGEQQRTPKEEKAARAGPPFGDLENKGVRGDGKSPQEEGFEIDKHT